MGGGFPSRYKEEIPELKEYGETIKKSLDKHFNQKLPEKIIIEPGRGIFATSGITIGRVIQVKSKDNSANQFIITLSTGKFSAGIFNVGNGFIFYLKTKDNSYVELGNYTRKADIYGKACASLDIIVNNCFVPQELKTNDIVLITGTGAYSGDMTTNWCKKSNPIDIFVD